ncbi:MAG: YraN family protein [Candidatus Saganbacteria bacterium]|nr:YraN family protein [Candidatus Saganbacteria bacterium]
MESYNLGRRGEAIAEQYLRDRGYRIIERNFRSRRGEIDIIAQDRKALVFVEVKYYSFKSFSLPEWLLIKRKQRSIIHTAKVYLQRKKIKKTFCRFDVLTIHGREDGSKVFELYKDAFRI